MIVTVYACRHPLYNQYADTAAEAALTETGQKQAEELAERFAAVFDGPDTPYILCSSALRTLQLADTISARLDTGFCAGDWLVYGPRTIEKLITACSGHSAVVACGHEFMMRKMLQLAGADSERDIEHAEVNVFELDTETKRSSTRGHWQPSARSWGLRPDRYPPAEGLPTSFYNPSLRKVPVTGATM